MFLLPHFAALIAALGLTLVPTWLGFWNHPLVKPTKLLVNFDCADKLQRSATKKEKEKHAKKQEKKLQKRRAKGLPDPVFYKKDKKGRISGGKDLPSTAFYPAGFCTAVHRAWKAHQNVQTSQTDHADRSLGSSGSAASAEQIGQTGQIGQ